MPPARTRGQALTEFIVIVPLFLLLLLGVIQLGMLFFAYQTVHLASFTACRAAIVRPCLDFHPNDSAEATFTPAVFSAAVLSTLAAAPAQDLFGDVPYAWLPVLPDSEPVLGLDFHDVNPGISAYKYANAAYLTAVRRVVPDLSQTPPVWTPLNLNPGQGVPCADADGFELEPPGQNVPPAGHDLSLEVTFLYPMIIPLVNRVFYGVFVNFSSIAQDLGIPSLPGDPEDAMIRPFRVLPQPGAYRTNLHVALFHMLLEYGFSDESRNVNIAGALNNRAWYPLPIRARTTLTVEASVYPMIGP